MKRKHASGLKMKMAGETDENEGWKVKTKIIESGCYFHGFSRANFFFDTTSQHGMIPQKIDIAD